MASLNLTGAGRAAAGLSVLAVLALAGAAAAQSPRGLELSVRVTDSGELPVRRAEVQIGVLARGAYVQRGFTDEAGMVTFIGLEAETHTVAVTHPDFDPASETADVRRGAPAVVSIRLHRRNRNSDGKTSGVVSVARLQVPAAARRKVESGLKQLERDPARAAEHFRRAIELHPPYAAAHALLGQALWKQVATNLRTCRTAEAGSGGETTCAVLASRVAETERSLLTALELDPELRPALTLLGRLFIETRRPAHAEAVLLESRRLDPDAWDAPFELARCYYQMGRLEESLQQAEQARQTPGAPAATRLLVADVLLRMARAAEAVAELEAFLRDPAAKDGRLAPRVRAMLEQLRARR